ncbi:MAG: DUF4340 domain-containing protein [Endomicrobia bacterium]|nr:DUF4340 domain-containing protein [Endomicrobiia bacterium]MCX7716633.1 DUF4340 domain-containing protein [Endomicrobiia bacterium]
MKRYFVWFAVILFLLCIWLLRGIFTSHYRPKFLFKNKQILQIEYKDTLKKEVVIKYENNKWNIITPTRKYNVDKQKFDALIDKLNNFKLLEMVSKKVSSFPDYNLDESSAFKLKILTKQKPGNRIVWLGKRGGFAYDEIYVRIDNKPEIFLAKGISLEDFKKPFYEYCDKRILKSTIDDINFIQCKVDNKTFQYKKELKEATTVWINIKTAKQLDFNKVDSYLRFFEEFIGDTIVEPTDFDFSQIKLQVETLLKYKDGTEVVLYFYDKIPVTMPEQWGADVSITYPVRIKCITTKGPSVEIIGDSELLYGIYDFRYKDFKEMPTKF